MAPLLELRDADAAYAGRPVLQNISLSLHAGERVSVLGKSGSGKSTLLGLLYARLARQAALVPQAASLVQTLSVFHNVYMGRLDAHGAGYNLANLIWPFPAERRAIAPVLETVGLDGFARRTVETLSGGQKQRTALARAIHRGGRVLIGDEPVSAVDERQAGVLIDELGRRFGTILLALHDVALARRIATRLVGIRAGRIFFDRATADVPDDDIHDLYRA